MLPGWFPDGRLVYLTQQRNRRRQIRIVMSLDLDTATPGQVSPVEVSVWGYAISADGNTVAFTVQDPGGRSVRKLFLMQLSGANAGVPVEVLAVPPLAQFFFPSFKR
jgi:Tol biopolymer transport system component